MKFLYTGVDDTLFSARPYFGGDMIVTITEIDGKHVAGTFRGIAIDRSKNDREIIQGRFVSPLKNSAGGATGGVLLWASEDCLGPIKVKVNNLPGEMTRFPFITPDCGESGSASYNLKPGSYRWVAYCNADSVSGIVDVRADSCSKIKIIFPFKPSPVTYTTNDSCIIKTIHETKDGNTDFVSADFAGNKVDAIHFDVDVYAGFRLITKHEFNYGTSSIDILGGRHQFLLDPQGRALQYTGLLKPDVWQSQRVIAHYFYDKGYLSAVRVTKADGTPFRDVWFSWDNGNIKHIKAEYLVGGGSDELLMDYYFDKNIKAFPYIFMDVPELYYFQSGLNFGLPIRNAMKSRRLRSFDRNGRLLSDNTWLYDNYIIDANKYIQALSVRLSAPFDESTHYKFTYHCF